MHVVFHRWCCFRHDWPSATFDQQMSHRWCCCLPLPFWLPFRPLWMPSPGPLSLEEGFLLEALATVGAGLLPLGVLRWFRWLAWGVWSIASPMSTGRPRGRWRDGVRRRHPNWRACSCFLCHAFGFWRKRHSRLCFHFLFHFFVGGLRGLFL